MKRAVVFGLAASMALAPGLARPAGAEIPSSAYADLIRKEAGMVGLPAEIADAVMAVESSYDPRRIGSVGEIGLMQVRPATAAMLGFRGSDTELAQPAVNIHFGVTYLAQAWTKAGGDLCRTLMKYRAGHGEERMSPLSAVYCQRARDHMARAGTLRPGLVAVASAVATPSAPAGKPSRSPGLPSVRGLHGSAFWVAHDLRVRMITARVEQRWKRMASAR